MAELAARSQRRTLSSFIEWAVEDALVRVEIPYLGSSPTSIAKQADQLWDVDAPDRFVRLALRFPTLLTHSEQVLWKLIRENGAVWQGRYDKGNRWRWIVREGDVDLDALRQNWAAFVAVANGEAHPSTLPAWEEEELPPEHSVE